MLVIVERKQKKKTTQTQLAHLNVDSAIAIQY